MPYVSTLCVALSLTGRATTTTAFVSHSTLRCTKATAVAVHVGQQRRAATAAVRLVGERGRLGVELGCASATEPVSGTARCASENSSMAGGNMCLPLQLGELHVAQSSNILLLYMRDK